MVSVGRGHSQGLTLDVEPYGYRGEGSWEGFGQRRAKACTQTPGLARECGQFLSRWQQCEGKTGLQFFPSVVLGREELCPAWGERWEGQLRDTAPA